MTWSMASTHTTSTGPSARKAWASAERASVDCVPTTTVCHRSVPRPPMDRRRRSAAIGFASSRRARSSVVPRGPSILTRRSSRAISSPERTIVPIPSGSSSSSPPAVTSSIRPRSSVGIDRRRRGRAGGIRGDHEDAVRLRGRAALPGHGLAVRACPGRGPVDQRVVEVGQPASHHGRVVGLDGRPKRGRLEGVTSLEAPQHRSRQCPRVLRWHELPESLVLEDPADAAGARRDDRRPGRQRLERRHAERLARAGVDQQAGAAHRGRHAGAVERSLELHGVGDAEVAAELVPLLLDLLGR